MSKKLAKGSMYLSKSWAGIAILDDVKKGHGVYLRHWQEHLQNFGKPMDCSFQEFKKLYVPLEEFLQPCNYIGKKAFRTKPVLEKLRDVENNDYTAYETILLYRSKHHVLVLDPWYGSLRLLDDRWINDWATRGEAMVHYAQRADIMKSLLTGENMMITEPIKGIMPEGDNSVYYHRASWQEREQSFDYDLKINIDPTDEEYELLDLEEIEKINASTDASKIIEAIKAKIVGQDPVIESVVANACANQIMISTNNPDLISGQKTSILIDGPTGTGKTAIIKELAEKLGIPVVITSATSYSMEGYVGGNLTDIPKQLLEKANGDLELAQRGIVCLDEFDKLSNMEGGITRNKQGIQQELLAFIGGNKYLLPGSPFEPKIEFDTTNLTFIGMGAFTKIREGKALENKQSIGFIRDQTQGDEQDQEYVVTAQDYIAFGLERELVGRFSLLTSTKDLKVEDLKNILLTSTISPLETFKEFASTFGIENVTYEEEFIQTMAELAYEMGFGARGLQKLMSDVKNELLLAMMNEDQKEIKLSAELLNADKHGFKRTLS